MNTTTILFTLSMPGRNSWNGRWSGDEKLFGVLRKFSGVKGHTRALALIERGYWSYNFGDGWRAGVAASPVLPEHMRATKKRLNGFCGYDWMIESILEFGAILNDEQIEEARAAKQTATA